MVKTNNRSPFATTALLVVLVIINALLAKYAAILMVATGAATIYPAVAFMIVFGLWFGGWGIIAAYLGSFIGAGLLDQMELGVNLYFSLADVWQVLIPVVAFKTLGADINLRTKRDWLVLLIFALLLNNLIGAAWGTASLAIGGVITWSEFTEGFIKWFLGNLAVVIVLAPLLLKFLSPVVQRTGLVVKRYWE